jgi:hypothetical protein
MRRRPLTDGENILFYSSVSNPRKGRAYMTSFKLDVAGRASHPRNFTLEPGITGASPYGSGFFSTAFSIAKITPSAVSFTRLPLPAP